MSKVSVLIQSFESKIKMLEQSIAQAAAQVKQWNDNHHGLTGMLQATKEALADAQKVMDVVAPESSAAEALNVAEEVVNVVGNVADNVESLNLAPEEQPASN